MINRSISVKFATIITFLIAAISIFIYFYFPYKLEMQARQAIAEKAASISEMTAFSISPSLLFRDKEAAEEALQGTLQNEDLAYVMIVDDGGEVFGSFNEQIAREANYWKAELEGPVSAPGGYYRTVTPILYNSRVIGRIYLGLSLEHLEDDIEASRTAVALVSSLIFLFGMAAVFLISSLINKPLSRLVNIVDKIARGDLSQRVKVSSKDEIGQLAGSLNSMISSLESAYSRLGNLNRLLEHEVAERTGELRQEIGERRKAEEEARAASRAKSDFLANISHEIRTPLSGTLGAIDLLLDTELDPAQQDYTQAARISLDSLQVIINDILDFARFEAGKLKIEPIPFDLQSVVNEVASLFKHQIQEKDIQLIVEFSQLPPNRVIGDPWRLRQVLINLIGNAVKFTAGGYVKVYVDIGLLASSKVIVRFSVQDNGIGIPQEKLENVFEKFTHLDSSDRRKYGGAGLGLTISRQIVEMMGGSIGASSREGKGSIFWFTLKLPLLTGVKSDPMLLSRLQGMNMLIVVDQQTEREMLQKYAEHLGMNTTAVSSAEDALKVLIKATKRSRSRNYHFAVIDSNLPGEAAYDFSHRLSSELTPESESQLMLLGLADHPGQARRMSKAGYISCFFKPVSASQFLDMLVMILYAQSGEEASRSDRAALEYESGTRGEPEPVSSKGANLAHVLLAEDNFVNRKLAVWMLNKLGCRVDLAVNGEEAVKMVKSSSYDLVLMDCQMPTMDGYKATALIRAARGRKKKHLPIIAVTDSATKSERKRCLRVGMDDHVSKPIRPDDLKAVLERWTGERIEQGVKDNEAEQGSGKTATGSDETAAEGQKEETIEIKSSPVLDSALSSIMVESDEEEKKEIIGLFKEDAAERMESLGGLLLLGNLEEASIHTHNLVGSAGSIGAERFLQTCQETHLAIKEKDLNRSRELFGAMTKELQILRQAIDCYLKSPDAGIDT